MRLWRLIKLVAGGGMLVVLGAAALMLWPLLWPPDPDASVQLVNGRLMGETTGYVGRIDRDARTVDVSASLVGWRPVVLAVNESTAILVQNRQGGFGDLWKDMPVRVSYEIVGDRRLAKSIEVVTGDGEPSRAAVNGAVNTPATPASPATQSSPIVSPPTAIAPSPAAVAPPPAARVADPAPVRTPTPSNPVPARADTPPVKSPPPTPPVRAAVPAGPEKPAPAVVVEPPRPVEPPAARASQPPAEPSSTVRRSSPGESDAGDGAAAIDWLLKERVGR